MKITFSTIKSGEIFCDDFLSVVLFLMKKKED